MDVQDVLLLLSFGDWTFVVNIEVTEHIEHWYSLEVPAVDFWP